MWIFTEKGFLSVVRKPRPGEESTLMVRSRRYDALAPLAASASRPIIRTPDADYPYRVIVEDSIFGAFMASQIEAIDYSNFKSRVSRLSYSYEHALHEIWAVMRMQEVLAVEYLAFSTEDDSLESIQGECFFEDLEGLRSHLGQYDEWRFKPLYELPPSLVS
jgi:mRNA-degrading endonuclease toxin of MazEF toxin-antitoxin module